MARYFQFSHSPCRNNCYCDADGLLGFALDQRLRKGAYFYFTNDTTATDWFS